MSKLRKYLALTERADWAAADYDRVLSEWDIPLDERITAYEANMWLHAQLAHNDEIVPTCVVEGLCNEDWDAAVEFVWKCLRHGVVPNEYVNQLIKYQQAWDEFFC